MEVQRIKVAESDRVLVSGFMGEEFPAEIDFNWLMPVVDKIGFLNFDVMVHLYVESKNGKKYNIRRCLIEDSYKGEISIDERDELPIIAMWKAVIKFIQWHNTQTKKQ